MSKEIVLELPFAAGIDQSQRAELLDPRAAWVNLENVRQEAAGSVQKRYGFAAQTLNRLGTFARPSGRRMFAHDKQVCVVDGQSVLDGMATGPNTNILHGRAPDCTLSMMKAPAPQGTSFAITDSILCGNYVVLVYTSSSTPGIYASVVDATNGAIVRAPELVFTSTAGETFALLGTYSTYVVAVIADAGSLGAIRYRYIDTANLTSGWAFGFGFGNVATDQVLGPSSLTIGVQSVGDRIALAYVNNSGGASQVTVKTFTIAAILDTATVNTGGATPTAVGVDGNSGVVWISWNETTSIKLMSRQTTNLANVTATAATMITVTNAPSFDGIAIVADGTIAGRLFVNDGSGDKIRARSFTTTLGVTVGDATTGTALNVQRSGAPFAIDSRYYAPCRGADTGEQVVILCDLTDNNAWVRPVANVAPRLSGVGFAACRSVRKSTYEYWLPVSIRTAGSVVSAQLAVFDFLSLARWRPVRHGGTTYLSGGVLSTFDGVRVAEASFLIRPPIPTLVATAAGTKTGTFRFVAVYEQVDATGAWHVSGVSPPVSTGAIAAKQIDLTVRPLGISGRISSTTDPTVRISIYGTDSTGLAPFYYITSISNALTATTTTITDISVGAAGAATLYAQNLPGIDGSAQDRRAPCGLTHIASYNGMLVGAQGEVVYYSGQDVDGEGAWWNPAFAVPVSGGGDITALDCQDGTLYAFKRERIYALVGEPPADNGSFLGFSPYPQRLAVDVGATQPFTCVTALGIFFVSARGIELLTRGRTVEWIGERVKDTFDAFPNVTAMTYDAESSCVLIELASSVSFGAAGGSGRTLVFDTRSSVWRSIDRRSISASYTDVPAQDAAMVWNGSTWRYAWLSADGVVYIEDHATHLDPSSTWVKMRGQSSWIHIAGVHGEQQIDRVILQHERHTAHDFASGIAHDYDDTTVTKRRRSDDLARLTKPCIDRGFEQLTGQAVMVEFEDYAPTGPGATVGTGKGATWIVASLSGEPKRGPKRTSGAERGAA